MFHPTEADPTAPLSKIHHSMGKMLGTGESRFDLRRLVVVE
jgi:hypothetical protein